jgi:hypothetical protein
LLVGAPQQHHHHHPRWTSHSLLGMAIPAEQLAVLLDSELRALSAKAAAAARQAAERALAKLSSMPKPTHVALKDPALLAPFLTVLSQPRTSPDAVVTALQSLHRQFAMGSVDPGSVSKVLGCLRLQVRFQTDTQRRCSRLWVQSQSTVVANRIRVLQILPVVFASSTIRLASASLAEALSLCVMLLNDSESTVSQIAGATLRQLVGSLFDRAAAEEGAVASDAVSEAKRSRGIIHDKSYLQSTEAGSALEASLALLQDLTLALRKLAPRWLSVDADHGASGAVMVGTLKAEDPAAATPDSTPSREDLASPYDEREGSSGSPLPSALALDLLETIVVAHSSLISHNPALCKVFEALVVPTLAARIPEEVHPRTLTGLFRVTVAVICEFSHTSELRDSLDALVSVLIAMLREVNRLIDPNLPDLSVGQSDSQTRRSDARFGGAAAKLLAQARRTVAPAQDASTGGIRADSPEVGWVVPFRCLLCTEAWLVLLSRGHVALSFFEHVEADVASPPVAGSSPSRSRGGSRDGLSGGGMVFSTAVQLLWDISRKGLAACLAPALWNPTSAEDVKHAARTIAGRTRLSDPDLPRENLRQVVSFELQRAVRRALRRLKRPWRAPFRFLAASSAGWGQAMPPRQEEDDEVSVDSAEGSDAEPDVAPMTSVAGASAVAIESEAPSRPRGLRGLQWNKTVTPRSRWAVPYSSRLGLSTCDDVAVDLSHPRVPLAHWTGPFTAPLSESDAVQGALFGRGVKRSDHPSQRLQGEDTRRSRSSSRSEGLLPELTNLRFDRDLLPQLHSRVPPSVSRIAVTAARALILFGVAAGYGGDRPEGAYPWRADDDSSKTRKKGVQPWQQQSLSMANDAGEFLDLWVRHMSGERGLVSGSPLLPVRDSIPPSARSCLQVAAPGALRAAAALAAVASLVAEGMSKESDAKVSLSAAKPLVRTPSSRSSQSRQWLRAQVPMDDQKANLTLLSSTLAEEVTPAAAGPTSLRERLFRGRSSDSLEMAVLVPQDEGGASPKHQCLSVAYLASAYCFGSLACIAQAAQAMGDSTVARLAHGIVSSFARAGVTSAPSPTSSTATIEALGGLAGIVARCVAVPPGLVSALDGSLSSQASLGVQAPPGRVVSSTALSALPYTTVASSLADPREPDPLPWLVTLDVWRVWCEQSQARRRPLFKPSTTSQLELFETGTSKGDEWDVPVKHVIKSIAAGGKASDGIESHVEMAARHNKRLQLVGLGLNLMHQSGHPKATVPAEAPSFVVDDEGFNPAAVAFLRVCSGLVVLRPEAAEGVPLWPIVPPESLGSLLASMEASSSGAGAGSLCRWVEQCVEDQAGMHSDDASLLAVTGTMEWTLQFALPTIGCEAFRGGLHLLSVEEARLSSAVAVAVTVTRAETPPVRSDSRPASRSPSPVKSPGETEEEEEATTADGGLSWGMGQLAALAASFRSIGTSEAAPTSTDPKGVLGADVGSYDYDVSRFAESSLATAVFFQRGRGEPASASESVRSFEDTLGAIVDWSLEAQPPSTPPRLPFCLSVILSASWTLRCALGADPAAESSWKLFAECAARSQCDPVRPFARSIANALACAAPLVVLRGRALTQRGEPGCPSPSTLLEPLTLSWTRGSGKERQACITTIRAIVHDAGSLLAAPGDASGWATVFALVGSVGMAAYHIPDQAKLTVLFAGEEEGVISPSSDVEASALHPPVALEPVATPAAADEQSSPIPVALRSPLAVEPVFGGCPPLRVWHNERGELLCVSHRVFMSDSEISSALTHARDMVRVSLSIVQSTLDLFADSLSIRDLEVAVEALGALASQVADVNGALTAITYIWNAVDTARRLSAEQGRTGESDLWRRSLSVLAEVALGGSLVSGVEEWNASTVCRPGRGGATSPFVPSSVVEFSPDHPHHAILESTSLMTRRKRIPLWIRAALSSDIVVAPFSLTAGIRPEARASAVQTLFSAITSHCHSFSPELWHAVLGGIVLPLAYEVTSAAHAASQADTVESHGLKASVSSHWRETRVLCCQGLVQAVCTGFSVLSQQAWFHDIWSGLLALLERSIVGSAGEAMAEDVALGSVWGHEALLSAGGGAEKGELAREALGLEGRTVASACMLCVRELALLVCVPGGMSDASTEEKYSLGMRVVDGALVRVEDEDDHDEASVDDLTSSAPSISLADPQAFDVDVTASEVTASREALWRDVVTVLHSVARSRTVACDPNETVASLLIDCTRAILCASMPPTVVARVLESHRPSWEAGVDPSCVLGTPRCGPLFRLVASVLSTRLRSRWAAEQPSSLLLAEELRWPSKLDLASPTERLALVLVEKVAETLAAKCTASLVGDAAPVTVFSRAWADLLRLTLTLGDDSIGVPTIQRDMLVLLPIPALCVGAVQTLDKVVSRAEQWVADGPLQAVFHSAITSLSTQLLHIQQSSQLIHDVLGDSEGGRGAKPSAGGALDLSDLVDQSPSMAIEASVAMRAHAGLLPVHVWGVGVGGAYDEPTVVNAAKASRLVQRSTQISQSVLHCIATLASAASSLDMVATTDTDRIEMRITSLVVALEGTVGLPAPRLEHIDRARSLAALKVGSSSSGPEDALSAVWESSDKVTAALIDQCILKDSPVLAFPLKAAQVDPRRHIDRGEIAGAPIPRLPPWKVSGIVPPLLTLNKELSASDALVDAVLGPCRDLDDKARSSSSKRHAALNAAISTTAFVTEHFARQCWASHQLVGAAHGLGWALPSSQCSEEALDPLFPTTAAVVRGLTPKLFPAPACEVFILRSVVQLCRSIPGERLSWELTSRVVRCLTLGSRALIVASESPVPDQEVRRRSFGRACLAEAINLATVPEGGSGGASELRAQSMALVLRRAYELSWSFAHLEESCLRAGTEADAGGIAKTAVLDMVWLLRLLPQFLNAVHCAQRPEGLPRECLVFGMRVLHEGVVRLLPTTEPLVRHALIPVLRAFFSLREEPRLSPPAEDEQSDEDDE